MQALAKHGRKVPLDKLDAILDQQWVPIQWMMGITKDRQFKMVDKAVFKAWALEALQAADTVFLQG